MVFFRNAGGTPYSSDPVLDNKIKALLNVLVPTQKDYLFDIVNTKGPKTQTFELDGRTVKVTRQAGINIFFGAKK